MTISLHYNYTLDSTNPTYLGERNFLLKVAENDSLRLYGLGLGGSSSGSVALTHARYPDSDAMLKDALLVEAAASEN